METEGAVERSGTARRNRRPLADARGAIVPGGSFGRWRPKMAGFTHDCRMPKVPSPAPTSAATPADAALPISYEAGLQELEQLVTELESGQLPLDQLLGSYQRGAALLGFCRDKLQAVEDQIKVLDAGSLKVWTAE